VSKVIDTDFHLYLVNYRHKEHFTGSTTMLTRDLFAVANLVVSFFNFHLSVFVCDG